METVIDTRRNKGGRPPKGKSDLLRHKVKVGFTDMEFDTVTDKAHQSGRSNAGFIHDAALRARVDSHISPEQMELLRGVTGMGNNLNQIARQANMGGLALLQQECLKVVAQIGTLVTRILRGGDLSR